MDKRLVIIDGNSLINRAYYAMQRPMITKEGIYTQGIYGFLNMLSKIMDDYSPDYLVVAWDKKSPTFRHEEYSEYKAGRKKMPVELAMQMPIMKEILSAMNIDSLEIDGFEADDIIGTIAREGETQGLSPLIITGDKDALQLATDKTKVLITKKGISDFDLYDREKMIERYSLTPEQFIDLKGLMGDSSDNIPGIPGVGEKTGIKLLLQFGSVANLLANTDQISNAKLRAKVEDNSQLAAMSRRLATINKFVPIDFEIETFKIIDPDYDKLIDLYVKLEFNSFLKKLHSQTGIMNIDKENEISYETKFISSIQDLHELGKSISNKNIYIKVFSDNNHVEKPQIYSIALIIDNKYYYIDCNEEGVLTEFINILNTTAVTYSGHDLINDYYPLISLGLKSTKTSFDTAIAQYVLDPSKSNYQLKTLAFELLHYEIKDEKEFAEECGQTDMFGNSSKSFSEYGLEWLKAVISMREIQTAKVKENQLEKVLYEIELPLVEVLASMENDGFKVNRHTLHETGQELKKEILVLEKEIHQLAGEDFNINSPAQLGVILFEKLELPAGKKTKRGYSTSADILEKLKDKHPIIELVLKYRTISKLNSTYVEGLIPLIGKDGKIHAHFQQTVAATGRISCTEPNLQNIPIRNEMGRSLRKAFVPENENQILVGADYSQIELRILAHLSGDENLIDAFNNGDDIHRMTAARVFNLEPDAVTSLDRSRAKAVNFGVIYGMSGFGLSEELKISRKEAEKYINDYFEKHQAVKKYLDEQIAFSKEKGYSTTILGRKRYIHEINSSNYMTRNFGERLAMNSPIQGSAADIIKLAMIKVYQEIKSNFPKSKLILQVHDELIITTDKKEAEDVKKMLVDSMENVMRLKVKLESDLNWGDNWYQLK